MSLSATPGFALGALNWVERHLSFFAPSRDEPRPNQLELQALAELAVAVRLCLRNQTGNPSPAIKRVRSFLATLAADPYLWHRAVRFPGEFVPICDLVAAIDRPVVGNQLHALQQVIFCGALDGIDRTLVSELELRLSTEWAGLQSDFPSLDDLSRRCPKPPLPIFGSNDDCYTLTHLIIFATDFGNRPPPSRGWLSDRRYLARILSSYIVRCISEGNLDLLIEFLLSWQYLRFQQTTLTRQAWRFFVGHQSLDGSFQNQVANFESAAERAVVGDSKPSVAPDPERTRFSQRYHTTLLAVMAGASPEIQQEQPMVNTAVLGTKIEKCLHVEGNELIESARVSVEAVWRWVNSETDPFASGDSLETVGFSLLTWWIWRALRDPSAVSLDGPPEDLLRRSRRFDLGSYYLVERGSLTLNIITAGLVRRFDRDNSVADAFLEHINAVVAKNNPENDIEELALYEKKFILNALGFEHHPTVSSYTEVISAAEYCAGGVDRDRIDNLFSHIESLTGYGTRHVDIQPHDVWLTDLLQGLADDAFRKYDWPRASRCVRALGYLNLISDETSLGYLSFVFLHQLPDGSFGYLGPDSRAFFADGGDYRSPGELNLSIAIEALWMIAEVVTGGRWQLFRSLGEVSVKRASRRPTASGPTNLIHLPVESPLENLGAE